MNNKSKFMKNLFYKKIKAIESTDPENFTPKKLKEFFNFLPIWFIRFLCDMAVKQRLYNKNYNQKGEVYYSLNKK